MPRLEPIGEVENPEEVDFGPVVIPVVWYDLEGTRFETDIAFHPQFPAGRFLELVRSAGPDGVIGQAAILEYLESCVMPDSRDEWKRLLYDDDVEVSQQTVIAVYQRLATYYAGEQRPTKQRSGSPSGRSRSRGTSPAAASAKASGARKGSR